MSLNLSVGRSAKLCSEEYLVDLVRAIGRLDAARIGQFVETVAEFCRDGRMIFVAGNGGSASAASHMAADLTKATMHFERRPQLIALPDSAALTTAIANDESFDRSFSDRLVGAPRGSLLIILSVSGESPNLVAAAEQAKAEGVVVVGAFGRECRIGDLCEIQIVFGDADYGLTEDLHISLTHILVRHLNGSRPIRFQSIPREAVELRLA